MSCLSFIFKKTANKLPDAWSSTKGICETKRGATFLIERKSDGRAESRQDVDQIEINENTEETWMSLKRPD